MQINKVHFSVTGLGNLAGSLTITANFEPVSAKRVSIAFENATLVRRAQAACCKLANLPGDFCLPAVIMSDLVLVTDFSLRFTCHCPWQMQLQATQANVLMHHA